MTGAVIGGVPIIYDYDVAGRRVGKSVGGEETRFLHAGDMEIAEYADDGTLLRRYIPGGAVDARVAMVEGDSLTPGADDLRYYHADRLGNVAALTDGNGRVTDRYAYDPFGNEITGASTSGNPFRYTGRRYDPETGLYFYRARYYDAPLGRFLQVDPIGYADQWNLYTYVANDPVNATDPDGREIQLNTRDVFGFARHAYVTIIPDDQAAFEDNPDFQRTLPDGRRFATLGGGPSGGLGDWGQLEGGVNRGLDGEVNIETTQTLNHPEIANGNLTENQVIDNLFQAADAFSKRFANDYEPLPGIGISSATLPPAPTFNSNGYASGLLAATGFTDHEYPGRTPGWGRPVCDYIFESENDQ